MNRFSIKISKTTTFKVSTDLVSSQRYLVHTKYNLTQSSVKSALEDIHYGMLTFCDIWTSVLLGDSINNLIILCCKNVNLFHRSFSSVRLANIYLFQVNNRNTDVILMSKFEHISHLFIVFPVLTLNRWMFAH